jgi:hypothetical protein
MNAANQEIKKRFRFTSLQGNLCEVQLLDDGENAKVLNLNNKEQFKILPWREAYKLLENYAIKAIPGTKRKRT